MTYVAYRPVFITGGHGDVSSIPGLIRRICEHKQKFEITPLNPPIRSGGLSKLQRPQELERFISLAELRANRDSIVVLVDCDDGCAKDEVAEFASRLQPFAERFQIKIAVGFFVREFESLFIHCLPDLAARYPELGIVIPENLDRPNVEGIRNAKGFLNKQMTQGSYKPTRDQAKFVHALNFQTLATYSRTFKHLCSCIDFLVNPDSSLVYPTQQ